MDLDAANREYIDQLYEQYRTDPTSLDEKWGAFFQGFELGYGRAEEGEEAE